MATIGSQDWAIRKIRGVRDILWEIPEAALATYNSMPPALRLPLNARAIANNLNCYVIDEARKRFDGIRGSKFINVNGTTYHLYKGSALWYKQLGEDGLPSNYPTDTAVEMMQGSFPFAPHRPVLIVGFRSDESMQNLRQVVIQRFTTIGKLQFYIELEKVSPTAGVVEMPSDINQAIGTRTRIRIRRGPEQEELLAQENE